MAKNSVQKFVDSVNKAEGSITAKQFYEGLKKFKTGEGITAYMDSHLKVNDYLPYQIKITAARLLVQASTFDGDGLFHVDSTKKRLMFVETVMRYYTNIHLDPNNIFEEYDIIQQNGIYDYVKSLIPEREMVEFSAVVDMIYSDIITNEYEPRNYISKQLTKLSAALDKVDVQALADKIKQNN